MGVNLRGRNFITLLDYTPEEIRYLLDLAADFKAMKRVGTSHRYLEGKNAALIFEKTSTRTFCAFSVAAMDLGMGTVYLGPGGSQIGKKESIPDTARVLGRMFDGIEYRGFGQERVEALAKYAGVPVWNGLTDQFHPTQVLADLLTVEEKLGKLKGVNFTYMGDARNNMGNSLMVGCAKMGLNFTACAPRELLPDRALVEKCREIARESGSTITLETDTRKGAAGADVIYTDVWVSMGEPEAVWEKRISELLPYQVNSDKMKLAAPGALFMHCLPAYHNDQTEVSAEVGRKFGNSQLEVTDEVFESGASVVFREAENRMHTIKAVIYATLK